MENSVAPISRIGPGSQAPRPPARRNSGRYGAARQGQLREEAFLMHCNGWTTRQIAAELEINRDTVMAYIRFETQKRAGEVNPDRERQKLEAITFYNGIIKTSLEMRDSIAACIERAAETGGEIRVSVNPVADAIKAHERIDKITGIDAPLKIDATLQALSEALFIPEETKALNP